MPCGSACQIDADNGRNFDRRAGGVVLCNDEGLDLSCVAIVWTIADPVHLDSQRIAGPAGWPTGRITILETRRPKLRLRQCLARRIRSDALADGLDIAADMLGGASSLALYAAPQQPVEPTPDKVVGAVIDDRIVARIRADRAARWATGVVDYVRRVEDGEISRLGTILRHFNALRAVSGDNAWQEIVRRSTAARDRA